MNFIINKKYGESVLFLLYIKLFLFAKVSYLPMKNFLPNSFTYFKLDLLLTTLGLSIFFMLIINLIITFFSIQDLIKYTDLDEFSLAVKDGYYYVNNYKIEAPFIFNIFGIVFLWIIMIWHTLKTVNKTIATFLI